jgi:Domain of unknown function (DUF3291)
MSRFLSQKRHYIPPVLRSFQSEASDRVGTTACKYHAQTMNDINNNTHPSSHHFLLAHMNYGRLRSPINDPSMSEFIMAIGPVNALAKSTPGFCWSFDNDVPSERDHVDILKRDAQIMPQLSLWQDLESLRHFAFKSGHAMYYKRRKEWFVEIEGPYAVCFWWRRDWPNPTLKDAFDRLQHLKDHGPSEFAFNFATAKSYPDPSTVKADDWQ